MIREDYEFCISSITQYEIYSGTTEAQNRFWEELLEKTNILPFDANVVKVAVSINNTLKRKRKQIAIADLFIAATAVSNELPLATLNLKHFERIDNLQII